MRVIYSIFIYALMAVIAVGAYLVIKNQLNSKKQTTRPINSARLLSEYEEKLEGLNTEKAKLEAKQEKNPLSFNEAQNAALIRLSEDISQLEQAISEWRANKDTDEWTRSYDLCKIIYGEALKICRSLSENSQLGE